MRWVCKITESGGQTRITLPKTFREIHDIDQVDYLVIDDRDPANITIGRLVHGKKEETESS